MKITPSGSVPTKRAPASYFTGTVWQDPGIETPAPARLYATRVTFEPGARTAWHTHPLGQTLHVLSGEGFIQWRDGPAHVIREGDSVWIGPDEIHAHGASPGTSMCHIAITERVDGNGGYFHGPVSDEDYQRPFAAG